MRTPNYPIHGRSAKCGKGKHTSEGPLLALFPGVADSVTPKSMAITSIIAPKAQKSQRRIRLWVGGVSAPVITCE
jgi:hypothetical protein